MLHETIRILWHGAEVLLTSHNDVVSIGLYLPSKKQGVKTYSTLKATGKCEGCAGSNNPESCVSGWFPFGCYFGEGNIESWSTCLSLSFCQCFSDPPERSIKVCIVKGIWIIFIAEPGSWKEESIQCLLHIVAFQGASWNKERGAFGVFCCLSCGVGTALLRTEEITSMGLKTRAGTKRHWKIRFFRPKVDW